MKLYSENEEYKLYEGSMLDILEIIEPDTIDSIITDPPYELNFMSKNWDNSGIAFQKETWERCYEVLKPGGYLLAFGGSRTFHRIACAIEDAGFEIRDTIMWLYGMGFPKSLNIGLAIDKKNGVESIDTGIQSPNARPNCDKTNTLYESGTVGKDFTIKKATNEWEGWGTALKPSFEPIIVARKPFKGSLVDNVIEYGVGGINIDECRVKTDEELRRTTGGFCSKSDIFHNDDKYKINTFETTDKLDGRFPANTILTYDETDYDYVCGGFPITKDYGGETKTVPKNDIRFNASKEVRITRYNESGSASRYFMNCKYTGKDEEFRRYIYTPKASKKDRDEGLEEFEDIDGGSYQFIQDGSLDGKIPVRKNTHPTVKPTELMQYLVRLVSPPGSTILDCFNGSGSTGKAVMYENKERNKNYKYIGIELTEEYLPIAKARIEYVCNLKPEVNPQTSIFEFIEENK